MEMSKQFAQLLNNKNLRSHFGMDVLVDGQTAPIVEKFWLRDKLKMPDLKELCSISYVSSISLYVEFNSSPAVQFFLDDATR